MSSPSNGWPSRAVLKKTRIFVDRLSPDSVGVSRFLAGLGAEVVIAAEEADPALVEKFKSEPSYSGLNMVERRPDGLAAEFDILMVDLDGVYPPPSTPYIAEMRQAGKLVSTLGDVILTFTKAQTAGVTGSAGKSTTTMLLGSILREAQVDVKMPTAMLEENPYPNRELLGALAAEAYEDEWVVAELTSAHLEYMQSSPNVAIVTTLSPDHLTWHPSLEEYYSAKATIVDHQGETDWAILNVDDSLSADFIAPRVRSQRAWFSAREAVARGVYQQNGVIRAVWNDEQFTLAHVEELRLGRQYIGNYLAAATAAVAIGAKTEAIERALRSFRGLNQRCQFLAEVGGISIFNDGLAMTTRKARAGLEPFDDKSLIVVCGGVDDVGTEVLHGSPEERRLLAELCELIAQKASAVVVIGEAISTLSPMLTGAGFADSSIHDAGDVATAVSVAAELGAAGRAHAIVLSPLFWLTEEERAVFDKTMVPALTKRLARA